VPQCKRKTYTLTHLTAAVPAWTPGHQYDGAIMVTASHLPVNRNGAKFCTANGGLEKKDITWLLTRAAEVSFQGRILLASVRCSWMVAACKARAFWPAYESHLARARSWPRRRAWCLETMSMT
jgi:hypothetical protein